MHSATLIKIARVSMHLSGAAVALTDAMPIDAFCDALLDYLDANDVDAELVSMTRDQYGHAHARLRPAFGKSIEKLAPAVSNFLPLAVIHTRRSDVDGAVEIDVRMPTKRDLQESAVCIAKRRLLAKLLRSCALLAAGIAAGSAICIAVAEQHGGSGSFDSTADASE